MGAVVMPDVLQRVVMQKGEVYAIGTISCAVALRLDRFNHRLRRAWLALNGCHRCTRLCARRHTGQEAVAIASSCLYNAAIPAHLGLRPILAATCSVRLEVHLMNPA